MEYLGSTLTGIHSPGKSWNKCYLSKMGKKDLTKKGRSNQQSCNWGGCQDPKDNSMSACAPTAALELLLWH